MLFCYMYRNIYIHVYVYIYIHMNILYKYMEVADHFFARFLSYSVPLLSADCCCGPPGVPCEHGALCTQQTTSTSVKSQQRF
jgi:hypothetical protein